MSLLIREARRVVAEHEDMARRIAETRDFLRTVGPRDPRSSGFVAERALERLLTPEECVAWVKERDAGGGG